MEIKTNYLLAFELLSFLASGLLYFFNQPEIAKAVLVGTVILAALPFFVDMVKDIIKGHYGIDILAMTAITASLLLGEYIAAGIIIVMLTGGEALEDFAQNKAKQELTALMARAPQMAHVLVDGKIVDLAVEKVKVGDLIFIKPGETVPVDALVTEGVSSFDESAITGESLPVEKTMGADLVSGSVNSESAVKAKAIRTSGNSQYQQIIKLVEVAASSQSPMIRLADYYSIPFTLLSFAIAGTAWFFSGSALRALEVLVVATPCPLLIATPVAIVAGMSRSARHGIIIKSGGAIEQLARIKAMAFDKTGTLTIGHPTVSSVEARGISQAEVLQYAAALSEQSAHVLSHAVVNEAQEKKLVPSPVDHINEQVGSGVSASSNGKKLIFGKYAWLQNQGVSNLPTEISAQTAAFLAIDGNYVGAIYFSDPLRPEAKSTLQSLTALGIKHMIMLTGDREAVASKVASDLGNLVYKADCKPQDKVEAVSKMKKEFFPLAMVGDGVNDAPVLVAADVGIAIGARGSTAASESANIVIMPNDIKHVASAVEIARRTVSIAKQSIFVGIGLSVFLMLLATTGAIKPVYGALLQEFVDVAVILNALRARHGVKHN